MAYKQNFSYGMLQLIQIQIYSYKLNKSMQALQLGFLLKLLVIALVIL